MSTVIFVGVFYDTTLSAVCDHVRAGMPGTTEPLRISAAKDEAQYEDEVLDLYIHALAGSDDYALEGEYAGTLAAAESWLEGFLAVLRARGASYHFDLHEEDDEGDVIGEMRAFRSIP